MCNSRIKIKRENGKEVKTMKKVVLAVMMIGIMAVAITGVYAFGPNADCGSGNCAQANCMGYTNLTDDQKAKVDQLKNEMLPLKQQMVAKRSELMSLRSQQNPDWTTIEKKQKEMVELRTEMQKKAFETGVQGSCGQCDGSQGMGKMGRGMCRL
jgi:Spy/CpxP family protein refolding chaperone